LPLAIALALHFLPASCKALLHVCLLPLLLGIDCFAQAAGFFICPRPHSTKFFLGIDSSTCDALRSLLGSLLRCLLALFSSAVVLCIPGN